MEWENDEVDYSVWGSGHTRNDELGNSDSDSDNENETTDNKNKIETIECECGVILFKKNLSKHKKTKNHLIKTGKFKFTFNKNR